MDNIEILFSSADDEKLKEFVLNELKTNEEFLNKFKIEFGFKVDKSYYSSKLNEFLYDDDFYRPLEKFIEEDIEYLLSKNAYELVCDLLEDIYDIVSDRLDDYSINDTFFYESILDDIEEIIPKLIDTSAHDDLFFWLYYDIKRNPDKFHTENLEEIFFDNFHDKYELESKLEVIDEVLSKVSPYSKDKWIDRRFKIMQDLNMSYEEIFEFRLEHYHDAQENKRIIDRYMDDKNYQKAIELLKEIEKSTPYKSVKYHTSIKLKEIYKTVDDETNYENELNHLLFDFNYPELKYYIEYRNNFSDKWEDKREEIFEKLSSHEDFLKECYVEEKLYGRLIPLITSENDIHEYYDYIVDDYSDELIGKYSEIIKDKASESGDRNHYKDIVRLLDDMADIENSHDEVQKILKEFTVKYSRRTAMMDELSKLIKEYDI